MGKLPDQWQKVMVTKKLGDGTDKNTIFLYPPGCPKEQKLKNNDELISFMQKNRSVPMNPNFVNFEVPLNTTGRTQLTDKVYLLRHFMEQLLQDQLSSSQSSQQPASDPGNTKSSSSPQPATSSTSGQKRKPVASLSAAQSKRLKGQSVEKQRCWCLQSSDQCWQEETRPEIPSSSQPRHFKLCHTIRRRGSWYRRPSESLQGNGGEFCHRVQPRWRTRSDCYWLKNKVGKSRLRIYVNGIYWIRFFKIE